MKRILSFFLFLLAFTSIELNAQSYRYLVKTMQQTDYKAFIQCNELEMCDGPKLKNGFRIGRDDMVYVPGYAEYNLNGAYESISFVLGNFDAPSAGLKRFKGIIAIYADGEKILDKVIANYDVSERYVLDISGVKKLRFEIIHGALVLNIAEIFLWKKGETPKESCSLVVAKPRKTVLVNELDPFLQPTIQYLFPRNKKFSSIYAKYSEYGTD